MRPGNTISSVVAVLAGVYSGFALSETSEQLVGDCSQSSNDTVCVQQLPELTVRAGRDHGGSQVVDQQAIEEMPVGEGNLADVLRTNPAVDFSREGRGSANSGVMRPEEFSFHGQPYYQNLFVIDGIDTTSDMDPGSGGDVFTSPSLVGVVGGSSPQGYYLDVGLLEQIEVYDSNVPASYGGFTGGVVDARVKRYQGEDFLSLRYGIQRDEWESFHIDEDDEEDFESADGIGADYTPDYRKDNYSLTAQQGLGDRSGLTLSASRRSSRFLQTYTDETDTEYRKYYDDWIDNVLARFDHRVSDRLDVGLSLRHADRTHDGLASTRYDDMFTKSHNAWGLGGNLDYRFASGAKLTLDMGIDRLSDEMDSESRVFTRHKSLEGRLPTQEGGYGDVLQRQTSYSLSPAFELAPFQVANTDHRLLIGSDLKYTDSYYERPESVIYRDYACVTAASEGCVDTDGSGISDYGDEYLKQEFVYGAGEVSLDYTTAAFYLDDRISWDNWQFRLGVRADYNSWLENIDLAPRLSADWDVFGNGSTHLLAGANRYYGRSFLRYAVNDQIRSWNKLDFYNSSGNIINTIEYEDESANYDLDTPYSDELMLGWVQQLGPVNSTLKLVQRAGRDQVRQLETDEGLVYYDNVGRSDTDSITWTLDHAAHPLRMGPTESVARLSMGWKDVSSDMQSDNAYDQGVEEEQVYYNDRLVSQDELPAWDYNTPLSISLSSVTRVLDWHLTWSNFVNLRNGGTIARDSGETHTDSNGVDYDVYEDYTLEDLVTLDTKLMWEPRLGNFSTGYLMLEVSNVFDDVISTKTSRFDAVSDSYTPGRKFWVEVGMRF